MIQQYSSYSPLPSRNGFSPSTRPPAGITHARHNVGPETGLAIPHVFQFAGIAGAGQSYLMDMFDEATRSSREQANCMRRDCFIQSLLQERAHAIASLKWHIEVPEPNDAAQKAIQSGLTTIVRSTPHLQKMLYVLADETIWVGRGGTQVAYEFRDMDLPAVPKKIFGSNLGPPLPLHPNPQVPGMPGNPMGAGPTSQTTLEKRRALCIRVHQPVSGDSINHTRDGTPLLLVNSVHANMPGAEVQHTTKGLAIALKGTWRPRFFLHQHLPMPAEFFDYEKAESIHGIGVRSVIYWWNNLRMEWISSIADWMTRTGLGVRVYHFQAGNQASFEAMKQAAAEQDDKVNILIPVFGEGKGKEGVEFVDTASTGSDLMLKLIESADGHIERYIVGQSMSSGQDDEGSLGGSGRAKFAESTKQKIVAFDANNLADTLTQEWIVPTLRWTYPEFRDLPVRFIIETDEPDPEKFMQSVKMFQDLGGDVKEDDVRGKISLSEIKPGDKILQPKQQAQPGAPGAPGQPPGGMSGGEPAPPGAAPPGPNGQDPEGVQDKAPPKEVDDKGKMPNGDSGHFDFARAGHPTHYEMVEIGEVDLIPRTCG